MKKLYEIGHQFGDWTLLERLAVKGTTRMWLCRCACGVVKVHCASNLTTGQSSRCGSCAAKLRERKRREKRA